ncbi:hypothetical protein [Acetobacter estunensis]|uniref:hypothetical protein n=1 Tax=Acetobacter estunensis TaxID=104097 RepID=UPI001C2DC9D2|nr:hypothetical protein [Acetobacter estunensis]MBV1836342.1 hypothetical protein [Acetobacter estunensis]
MRIVEAARLITTGRMDPDVLWEVTTVAERVTIALLVGRPDYLPQAASTPTSAWDVMDARCRNLVLRRAPSRIRRRLPGYIPTPTPLHAPVVETKKSVTAGVRRTHQYQATSPSSN